MTGSGGQVSWYPLPTLNKKRTESLAAGPQVAAHPSGLPGTGGTCAWEKTARSALLPAVAVRLFFSTGSSQKLTANHVVALSASADKIHLLPLLFTQGNVHLPPGVAPAQLGGHPSQENASLL